MLVETITCYCICDDLLKALGRVDDPQCKMGAAEVMTVGLVAALFFGGNIQAARRFLYWHRYIPKMLSHSRLNRRLLSISGDLWLALFTLTKHICNQLRPVDKFVVDSFPVPVCLPCRSWRCKLYQGRSYLGYCAAKKLSYYGLKVHLIVTVEGDLWEFVVTPASIADISALRNMDLDLPENVTLFADRAYNHYDFEEELVQDAKISLIAQRKCNSKRPHSGPVSYQQRTYRKRVETVISQITGRFSRNIVARSAQGFVLRLELIILAYPLRRTIEVLA